MPPRYRDVIWARFVTKDMCLKPSAWTEDINQSICNEFCGGGEFYDGIKCVKDCEWGTHWDGAKCAEGIWNTNSPDTRITVGGSGPTIEGTPSSCPQTNNYCDSQEDIGKTQCNGEPYDETRYENNVYLSNAYNGNIYTCQFINGCYQNVKTKDCLSGGSNPESCVTVAGQAAQCKAVGWSDKCLGGHRNVCIPGEQKCGMNSGFGSKERGGYTWTCEEVPQVNSALSCTTKVIKETCKTTENCDETGAIPKCVCHADRIKSGGVCVCPSGTTENIYGACV